MLNKNSDNKLVLELSTEELSPKQVRLIKSIQMMLANVVSTDEEDEFFDGSAELLRLCASLIKQSNFVDKEKASSIPYADQALEFSIDALTERMINSKVISYDN